MTTPDTRTRTGKPIAILAGGQDEDTLALLRHAAETAGARFVLLLVPVKAAGFSLDPALIAFLHHRRAAEVERLSTLARQVLGSEVRLETRCLPASGGADRILERARRAAERAGATRLAREGTGEGDRITVDPIAGRSAATSIGRS
ncbi:hypothetical protein ACFFGH_27445 [Lysobacter korlensis]|uniref:UspA domain-containing protein n=1 Tax=Lysobacter korlensis TaxID=553636 RepID=A0ABV6RX75_9GAMM